MGPDGGAVQHIPDEYLIENDADQHDNKIADQRPDEDIDPVDPSEKFFHELFNLPHAKSTGIRFSS
jgi:hypothetical protein